MNGRVELTAGSDWATGLTAAPGPVVIGVLVAALGATEVALIRATVAHVANARAPDVRVNAVVATPDTRAATIEAAVSFLAGAEATTGQTLELGVA